MAYKKTDSGKMKVSKVSLMQMEEMKPSLSIPVKMLKEIESWEVGKTYKVRMKIKETGRHKDQMRDSAEFEVQEVESNEEEME